MIVACLSHFDTIDYHRVTDQTDGFTMADSALCIANYADAV